MDEIIYKYRIAIGLSLLILILAGASTLVYNKYSQQNKIVREKEIKELRQQNDSLRQELSGQAPKAVAGESETSKININTADLIELDTLSGIGPARAQDIIDYRDTHGGYKSIEELKNIKGIGDKTFENMKEQITVGQSMQ